MYVVFEYDGRFYQMVQCPFCKGLIQVIGKKKLQKVRLCFYCGGTFVEEE